MARTRRAPTDRGACRPGAARRHHGRDPPRPRAKPRDRPPGDRAARGERAAQAEGGAVEAARRSGLDRSRHRHVVQVPDGAQAIPRCRRRSGDRAARRPLVRHDRARGRGVRGNGGARRSRRRGQQSGGRSRVLAGFHPSRTTGNGDDGARLARPGPRVADRTGDGAGEGQQRRAHDQRRLAGDRRARARRRRGANGRRGWRHRRARSAHRRHSRDGQPAARSQTDGGDRHHRTVRARVDGQAVHGGGADRPRARHGSRLGGHRRRRL